MTEKDSIAERASIYRQISESLGTDKSIPSVLKSELSNTLLAGFVDATFDAVEERAATITNNAPNADTLYCIALANALEMITITIDRLLERKCPVVLANYIANHLWGIWSGLDEAMDLCPDRQSWKPPAKVAEMLETIKQKLVQSAV